MANGTPPPEGGGGGKAGGGIKGTLTKKVGPLPLWGWGALGAIGLFFLMRGRGSGGSGGQGNFIAANPAGLAGSGATGTAGTPPDFSPLQRSIDEWNARLGQFAGTVDPTGAGITNGGAVQAHATTGALPSRTTVGRTAAQIVVEQPSIKSPGDFIGSFFTRASKDRVSVYSPGHAVGGVNPANKVLGYSGPQGFTPEWHPGSQPIFS